MRQFNRTLALIFCGTIFAIIGFSQDLKLASETYPEHRLLPLRGKVYSKTYIQIKGNPFLFKEWLPGTLYLNNNDSVTGVELRFDTYQQIVVAYIRDLNRLILPEEDLVTAFSINNRGIDHFFKRVNHDLGVKKAHSGYFLQVLYEGNMSLQKLFYNKTITLRSPEMPFIEEFVPESAFYLYINGNYEILRMNKAFLKGRFPEYKKEISAYTRKNKLKYKKEKDFAMIIAYLDDIMKKPEGIKP